MLPFINPAPWTPRATSDSHRVCSPGFPQACYVSESEAGLELLDPLSTTFQGEGLQTRTITSAFGFRGLCVDQAGLNCGSLPALPLETYAATAVHSPRYA